MQLEQEFFRFTSNLPGVLALPMPVRNRVPQKLLAEVLAPAYNSGDQCAGHRQGCVTYRKGEKQGVRDPPQPFQGPCLL